MKNIDYTLLKDVLEVVERADYSLTGEVVRSIQHLYQVCVSNNGDHLDSVLKNANSGAEVDALPIEYYKIVTQTGVDTGVSLQYKPSIEGWLKRSNNTLLVAHWLVHLIGLRHQSVHLFLGNSSLCDVLYLQIRSFKLTGHGGKLDISVGGHVAESEDLNETLERELKEELGLDLGQHVAGGYCEYLGHYNHMEIDSNARYKEIELRSVYFGVLTSSGILELNMRKDEVAGVVLIYKNELEQMLNEFPEFIASGLSGSFRFLLSEPMASSD